MDFNKNEKLFKQMHEFPDDLCPMNIKNLFMDLKNKIPTGKLKLQNVTEFLNLINTLFLFYVYIIQVYYKINLLYLKIKIIILKNLVFWKIRILS